MTVSADYDNFSDRIVDALRNVWQAIGSDIIECAAGEPIDEETIREVVIDDPGRMNTYGGDDQAAAAFALRPYPEKVRLLNLAFPDEEESR